MRVFTVFEGGGYVEYFLLRGRFEGRRLSVGGDYVKYFLLGVGGGGD